MTNKKGRAPTEGTEEINLASSRTGEVLLGADNLWSFIEGTSRVIQGESKAPTDGQLNRAVSRALKALGVDMQELEDAEFDVALALTDPQGSVADVKDVVARVLGSADDDAERAEIIEALGALGDKVATALSALKDAGDVAHPLLDGEGRLRVEAMKLALR